MAIITPRIWQFTWFDTQLSFPDWLGKRVLDFGGNAGNFLRDPNVRTEPENYWCIEVMPDVIAEGQRLHPKAHFLHYNRYNFEYNPGGVAGLPIPDPGPRFQFVLSYGVVPHLSQAETVEAFDRLRTFLTADGVLAFAFLDPQWTAPPGWTPQSIAKDDGVPRTNLRYYLEAHPYAERRRLEEPGLRVDLAGVLARAAAADLTYVTVLDDDELYLDPDDVATDHRPTGRYLTFCTPRHMQRLFPDALIRPPVPPERHHCAILHASQRG